MDGDEIKAWRVERGLSQPDLAQALGVHWKTVQAWERGYQAPPLYVELALCELARRLKKRPKSE